MLAPVSILFVQAWGPASKTVSTTVRETNGIAFLRALQPVLTALTEDESLAVSREAVDPSIMNADLEAASNADKQYGDELQTHIRWADFVKSVNNLQRLKGLAPIDAYSFYTAATDLLLDVYERIRDESGLVRDQEADVFYLEDAASDALPAAVIDAGRYGDSIIAEYGPAAGLKSALLNVATYRALLDKESDDVGDDVSDAVDATASQTMSNSLLSADDHFRTSIEALEPTLLTPVTKGDTEQESSALQAKAQEESSATALSSALFDEISTLVTNRGNSARAQERLALLGLLLALLVIGALIYLDLRRVRPRWSNRPSRPARPSRPPGRSGPGPDQGDGRMVGSHWGPEDVLAGLPQRERSGVPQ